MLKCVSPETGEINNEGTALRYEESKPVALKG